MSGLIDDEADEPRYPARVKRREESPLPMSSLTTDCDEGRDTREVKQDKENEGVGDDGREGGRAISTDLLLHASGELREGFVSILSITRIDDPHRADDDFLSHETRYDTYAHLPVEAQGADHGFTEVPDTPDDRLLLVVGGEAMLE